jgi:WD40 repeat protein
MSAAASQKPESPYPGLRPFEPHEASIFFGRAEQIVAMLTKLETRRFLAVVGASGSGKSSLVRAGLLPALRDGFLMGTTDDWLFVIARPGSGPYASLADSFCRAAHTATSEPTPVERSFAESQLRSGRLGVVELLRKLCVPAERHVLVLIDQFEELFRFRSLDDADKARNDAIAFVDLLLKTAEQKERTVHVVITMRSDFLGDCNAFFGLPEAISDSQFLVPRLARDQLAAAIEGPLLQFQAKIQSNVVNHIVNEVGADQDQLPLMQHALMRMWRFADKPKRNAEPGTELNADHYDKTGGVEKALNLHAHEIYQSLVDNSASGAPSPKQHVAEWLFRCLASRTSKGQLVRRLTTVREVAAIAGAALDLVYEVVREFAASGRNFLVTSPPGPLAESTSIDICHESLLRQWHQLRDWVKEESDASSELLKLVEDAELWKSGRRGLLRQPELGLFQKWRRKSVPSTAWAARYVAPGQFELAEEYLRRSHVQERRSRVILGAIVGTTVAVLLTLTSVSYYLRGNAQVAAKNAQAQEAIAKASAKDADERREEAETLAGRIEFEHYFAKAEDRPDLALVGVAKLLPRALRLKDQSMADRLRLHLGAWSAHAVRLNAICAHKAGVVSVALSADGKWALTGSFDKTAQLWETATGKPIGPPLKHDDTVVAAALSADGKTALTGSKDKTARLWNTATGEPIGKPLQHQNAVIAVALSADGKTALTASQSKTGLTGSKDKAARLWEVATGKQIGLPLEHQDAVVAVTLSADGKTALTGSVDRTARLWEADTGKAIGPLLQHQGAVIAVALSADGMTALTGSRDKTARLWNKETGKQIGHTLKHHDEVVAVALSPDGKIALTGSLDQTARLWDAATGDQIGLPLQHQSAVVAVALSADGTAALTGSHDKTARLWQTATGKPIAPPLLHQDKVVAVALSGDGKTVLSGSHDKTARLWEMAAAKMNGLPLEHEDEVVAVAVSADGKTALTGSFDKTARLWDTATGKPIGSSLEHKDKDWMVAVALSADGKIALTGGQDGTAQLWKTATGMPIGNPLPHKGPVVAVALSADGTTALTGSKDKTARLWEAATGKPIGEPVEHQDAVVAVALSADGKTALTGSRDETARLWGTATEKATVWTLRHKGPVVAVALSADGKIALTGSQDKTARLWNPATGEPIGMPLEHGDEVVAVALSADGKLALTGSRDKTARLWNAASVEPIGVLLLLHQSAVAAVALSADGKTALTGSYDRKARLWDTASGRQIGPALQHQGTVGAVALSADSKTALTGSKDATARLWVVSQPLRGDSERIMLWTQMMAGFDLDNLAGVHVLDAAAWQQRRQRLQELGGPPVRE